MRISQLAKMKATKQPPSEECFVSYDELYDSILLPQSKSLDIEKALEGPADEATVLFGICKFTYV